MPGLRGGREPQASPLQERRGSSHKSAGVDAAPAETAYRSFGMRLPPSHSCPSNPPFSCCLLMTNNSSPVSSHPPPVWTSGLRSATAISSPGSALLQQVPSGHLKRLKKATSQRQQKFGVDAAASVCGTGSEMFFPGTAEFFISDFCYKVTGSCRFIIHCWK